MTNLLTDFFYKRYRHIKWKKWLKFELSRSEYAKEKEKEKSVIIVLRRQFCELFDTSRQLMTVHISSSWIMINTPNVSPIAIHWIK